MSPWAAMWASIRSRTRRQPLVGLGDGGVEVVGEAGARPIDGREPAGEGDAVGGEERRQVDVAAAGPADELQRWLASGVSSGAHLVDGAVECADLVEPPEDVHASVAARHPRVAANGEVHVASGASQLVGELHPGGRGADDEHAAVGELAGVPVAGRGELFDGRVEPGGDRGIDGWSHQPVAITTLAACQLPRSVATSKPSPWRRRCSTVVCGSIGASNDWPYAARNAATSAAVMKPSGCPPE